MGLPDSERFSDQSQLSLGFSNKAQAKDAATKCHLEFRGRNGAAWNFTTRDVQAIVKTTSK